MLVHQVHKHFVMQAKQFHSGTAASVVYVFFFGSYRHEVNDQSSLLQVRIKAYFMVLRAFFYFSFLYQFFKIVQL